MAHASNLRDLLDSLGRAGKQPVRARQYRSVAITEHALDAETSLEWRGHHAQHGDVAGIVYALTPLHLECQGADVHVIDAEGMGFLHPMREHRLWSERLITVTCIWVPWDALSDIEDGLRAPASELAATPLTGGLRAFTQALIGQPSAATPYTDYMVERILAEMTFGVLVEAAARNVSGTRETRAIDRARTLMLLRRADPAFGAAEIARELHMSVRQLQRVFAAAGSAPASELRRLRVDLARDILSDPTYRPLTVDQVAGHSGFSTAAAMRRAFAALELPTPLRTRRDAATEEER